MENILKCIDSNNPITVHGQNNLQISIISSEIIKDLKSFGLHQKKSYTLQFPKNIPHEYMYGFVRGLIDGDGSIWQEGKTKDYRSSYCTASEQFIYDLLEFLQKEIPDMTAAIRKQKNTYVLSFSTNDTRRLRNYIYKNIDENSLYLKRKYGKFLLSGDLTPRRGYRKLKMLSIEETSKFMIDNNIKTKKQWIKYKKTYNIKNIPSIPWEFYKNKGWTTWRDLVGTTFLDFYKAREFVQNLKLKNAKEWKQYSKSKLRPISVPSIPWSKYKEWDGMADWLGNN